MREQIKIYSKERDGKVICVCLASNKLCNRQCDTEMASLDEYEKISECSVSYTHLTLPTNREV